MKVYEVRMDNANTGESFAIQVEARNAAHAEKQVRAVYGRPDWAITEVKDTLFRTAAVPR